MPPPATRSLYEEFTVHTCRITLALLATPSASAALFIVQPAVATQAKLDPYMQGTVNKTDPLTQGADRQANAYDYPSWKYDRFDPYT